MPPRIVVSFSKDSIKPTHSAAPSADWPVGENLRLPKRELHYLRNVLRIQQNERLEVIDSDTGKPYLCELISSSSAE